MNKKDQEQLERIMTGLGCSESEALEILEYDKKVEKGEKTEFDLTDEQKKVAKKMTQTTGKKREPRAKTTKPDDEKENMIAAIAKFLESTDAENINILNPTRQVGFMIGNNRYELTLIKKK